ncbi:MAG: hypothetical protein Q9227_009359 [Pyrenula ochraceoflavens]
MGKGYVPSTASEFVLSEHDVSGHVWRLEDQMNRRERRNAANTDAASSSAADIPLAWPSKTKPIKTKTLYEIAAEKQAELSQHGQPFLSTIASDQGRSTTTLRLSPDGSLQADHPTLTASPATYTSSSEYPVSSSASELQRQSTEVPFLDSLFTSLTLSILHFTLSVLTAHQYAQSIDWTSLSLQTILGAVPILTFLVHLSHGHIFQIPFLTSQAKKPSLSDSHTSATHTIPLQILFLLLANVCGCYLITLTNDRGYYAVMKRAPSIGTLWVWSVLELGLYGAVGGVAGPAAYALWYGYGIY